MKRTKKVSIKAVFFAFFFIVSCHSNSSANKINFLKQIENNHIKAIIVLSTDCPICQKYQGSFLPIIKKYHQKVDFIFLFPNQAQDSSFIQFCNYDSLFSCKIKPTAMANDFQFLKVWGVTTTPQLIILNNKNKQVYSGKIDDRFLSLGNQKPPSENYLEKVLNSLLKNEEVKTENTEPIGCIIQY